MASDGRGRSLPGSPARRRPVRLTTCCRGGIVSGSACAPRLCAALRASTATTSGLTDPTASAALKPACTSAWPRWRCSSSTSTRARVPGPSPSALRAAAHHASCDGVNAGLAQQDLQVVIQIEDLHALAGSPLVPGHHHVLVTNRDRRGGQFHPNPVADEPGRHRVLAAAHHHLGVPVDPRGEGQRGVERLGRQRPQQLPFKRPVVSHAARAVADAPPVTSVVPGLEQRIQLINRADSRHRDAVVATKPAAFALHAALLMAALVAGLAVERVKAVVRSGMPPTGRTRPGCGQTAPATPPA